MIDRRSTTLPRLDRDNAIQTYACLFSLLPAGFLAATASGLLPVVLAGSVGIAVATTATLASVGTALASGRKARQHLTASERQREHFQQRLRLDPLTDLMNREAFTHALDTLSDLGEAGSTVIVPRSATCCCARWHSARQN
jgi:hypothetical protein